MGADEACGDEMSTTAGRAIAGSELTTVCTESVIVMASELLTVCAVETVCGDVDDDDIVDEVHARNREDEELPLDQVHNDEYFHTEVDVEGGRGGLFLSLSLSSWQC